MLNHSQLVALANAIQTIRPDWQQTGIVAQLKILSDSWGSSDGALSAHAMLVAANPMAQTPGAFNAAPSTAVVPRQQWHEPSCHTCSRTRSQCARMRAFEVRHGIPDVHEFESWDEWLRTTRQATNPPMLTET